MGARWKVSSPLPPCPAALVGQPPPLWGRAWACTEEQSGRSSLVILPHLARSQLPGLLSAPELLSPTCFSRFCDFLRFQQPLLTHWCWPWPDLPGAQQEAKESYGGTEEGPQALTWGAVSLLRVGEPADRHMCTHMG